MVPVQVLGSLKYFLQIIAQVDFMAIALRFAQGFADQVFDQDGFFTMRLVLRCSGLEIKTDGG